MGETRSHYGLGSQLACCARAKAVEAVKAARTQEQQRKPHQKPLTCPQFGPRGSVRYDARTYRLMSLDRVSLNTVQGRVTCRLILGKRQHDMLIDPRGLLAVLIWCGEGHLLPAYHPEQRCSTGTETADTIGVDLGMVNVATDSDG